MTWDNRINRAMNGSNGTDPSSQHLPATISAQELQRLEFPPVSWIVKGLMPEGLTLLAGKPKLGKSWLALQIGQGVAGEAEVLGRPASGGTVLYAALEDNMRRLKSRLSQTNPTTPDWPEKLHFATEWPRLDKNGLENFGSWLNLWPDARLLIIDTLATVRPTSGSKESLYQSDYAALRGLHALANNRGIGVLVVHHVRKADADDPFDTVLGSTGLTGAADTTLILSRTADGTVLYARGRDLSETEIALDFDLTTCVWADIGRPSDVFGSDTRKAIRSALKDGHQTPQDIAAAADLDYDLCAKTLQRMAEVGEVQKGGRGRYRRTPDLSCP